MSARRFLLSLALVVGPPSAILWGCGGIAEGDPAETTPVDAGRDALPDATSTSTNSKPDAGKDASSDAAADVKDALPEYTDPGCPDAPPPKEEYECDPNGKPTGCGDGEACYPFVMYPSGPCQQETYGAQCVSPGSGGQGDPCSDGCKANHVCVVSGQGTQCIQMCDLSAAVPCPDGLVCEPVDVPGIGGCI